MKYTKEGVIHLKQNSSLHAVIENLNHITCVHLQQLVEYMLINLLYSLQCFVDLLAIALSVLRYVGSDYLWYLQTVLTEPSGSRGGAQHQNSDQSNRCKFNTQTVVSMRYKQVHFGECHTPCTLESLQQLLMSDNV